MGLLKLKKNHQKSRGLDRHPRKLRLWARPLLRHRHRKMVLTKNWIRLTLSAAMPALLHQRDRGGTQATTFPLLKEPDVWNVPRN